MSLYLQFEDGLTSICSENGYRESLLSKGSYKNFANIKTVKIVAGYLGVSADELIEFLVEELDYPSELLPEERE